jgi:hypothetical protein
MRLHTATGWRNLLLSTLLCTSVLAKKDKPSVSTTSFPFIPENIQYFDDSDVILFQDFIGRVVYRSDDAGQSWAQLTVLPEGSTLDVMMHPFDNKRAYIITDERSHWMTKNRGETWEEFYTDNAASLFRPALTFHAKDPQKIIFNGMDCSGIFCEELVSMPL